MNTRLHRRLGVWVALAALATSACGGGASAGVGAKTPDGANPAPPPGSSYTAPGTGAQYGVNDAPSSGANTARPAMNASALTAYQAGMAAFQSGDLTTAQTQFTQATQADEKAYQAFYSLGVVKERLGDVSGALSAYRKASTVVADYEPAIVGYALLLARTGKASEAESYLTEMRGRIDKSAAVLAALGEVKSIQGQSGEAQQYAQEALKINPDYRPAMITIARDHYRSRRLDLALYALQGILDGFGDPDASGKRQNPPRDPNNAEARLIRGLIYRERGFRKEAVEEFTKAMTLRPDLVEARVQIAATQLEAGNAAEAAQLLETALKYDREHVLAHLDLGDAYRLLGRAADAIKQFDYVIQKDPSIVQVHYNLGLLYLFADSIPGMTAKQAAERAVSEFETYKRERPRGSGPDDTDEMITRAKAKIGVAEAQAAEAAAPPASSAAPAASGKAGT